MNLSNVKMGTIIKAVTEFGGATVDDHGSLVMFPDGYMVSKPGEVVLSSIHAEDLREQVEDYMLSTTLGDGEYYGFLIHEGALYSDVSVWISSREEAVAIGKKNNQIAIFNWRLFGEEFIG